MPAGWIASLGIYNWTIGVVSEKGEGSAFWVELPCRVKPIEK
ncbi:hypothetical protein [Alistipes sp.]|nr:hypothetical protein [Alistipes sp.]